MKGTLALPPMSQMKRGTRTELTADSQDVRGKESVLMFSIVFSFLRRSAVRGS